MIKDIRLMFLSLIPLGYIFSGIFKIDFTYYIFFILYIFMIFELSGNLENKIVKINIDMYIFIWILILLIGILYSPNFDNGITKIFKFIVSGISIIYFTRLFVKSTNDLDKVLKYNLFFSTISAYLINIDFVRTNVSSREYLAFGTLVPIPISLLAVISLVISVKFFIDKKIKAIWIVFIVPPLVSLIFIASSKGPVLALIISLLLFSLNWMRKIKILHYVILISIYFIFSRIEFIQKIYKGFESRILNASNSMSTNIRIDIYNKTTDIISENPILGIGTGGLTQYPHNIFLEVLSENGIALFILMMIGLSFLFKVYLKVLLLKKTDITFLTLTMLVVISLITLFFSYSYIDHKYLYLTIALLIKYIDLNRRENEEY